MFLSLLTSIILYFGEKRTREGVTSINTLLIRVSAATGIFVIGTLPVTILLFLFISFLSSDPDGSGADLFTQILLYCYIGLSLFYYLILLLIQYLSKKFNLNHMLSPIWKEYKLLIILIAGVLFLFGVPILPFMVIYWLSEKMKSWNAVVVLLIAILPIILLLVSYLFIFSAV